MTIVKSLTWLNPTSHTLFCLWSSHLFISPEFLLHCARHLGVTTAPLNSPQTSGIVQNLNSVFDWLSLTASVQTCWLMLNRDGSFRWRLEAERDATDQSSDLKKTHVISRWKRDTILAEEFGEGRDWRAADPLSPLPFKECHLPFYMTQRIDHFTHTFTGNSKVTQEKRQNAGVGLNLSPCKWALQWVNVISGLNKLEVGSIMFCAKS